MEFVRTPEEWFADLPGYPYEPHYVELSSGLRMHYIEDGPAHGEPILLLHGQPTWSYLYRTVIPGLVQQGLRVIAPDLVGYGRSDKPVHRTDCTVDLHVGALTELIENLALTGITLVAQDWGGPIGLGALSAQPERLARVVAANTVLHTAGPELAGRLRWACHELPDGTVCLEPSLLDYQRMTQELFPFRASLFVQGATQLELPEEVCAAYDAPFPDETYCAAARQLPLLMGLTPNAASSRMNQRTLEFLAQSTRPFLTAFSDNDPSTQGWETVLRHATPGSQDQTHSTIAPANHFLQEDAGPMLAGVIASFVEATPT
jgi:haloalkane dehalogenase